MKMRRLLLFLSMMFLSLTLVACAGNTDRNDQTDDVDQNANETEQGTTTEEEQTGDDNTDGAVNSDDMRQKMDELDYNEFELEVEYDNNEEYEAEIEQKEGMIKAELEDEINGEDLKDEEAFDKIYPFVKQLTIEKDTDKEDVIAEVLDVFNLDDNYKKFELEITFSDGVEMEFEDRK